MGERFKNYYRWISERVEQEEKFILNEGLITSYPADILINDLSKRYPDIEYIQDTGNIIIERIPLKHRESLKKKLELYGYFIGDEQIDDEDSNLFGILVEPKFPTEIPYSILHDKIQYLYHITTDKYIDKIKKIGLVPKRTNRPNFETSKDRIYLLMTGNPTKDIPMLRRMLSSNDQRKHFLKRPERYYILRMNFHQLNKDMVFYRDPRMFPEGKFTGTGIFTFHNIPPDKIEILTDF